MNKKRRYNKKQGFKAILYMAAVAYIGYTLIGQSIALAKVKNETKELEAKLKDEETRKKKIVATNKEYSSDEYVEKIAREKLGFVKANEIIFVDDENK